MNNYVIISQIYNLWYNYIYKRSSPLENNTITSHEISIYLQSYKNTFSRLIPEAKYNDENLRATLAAYIDSNNALISNIEFVIKLAEVDAFNTIINDENTVSHTMLVRVDYES